LPCTFLDYGQGWLHAQLFVSIAQGSLRYKGANKEKGGCRKGAACLLLLSFDVHTLTVLLLQAASHVENQTRREEDVLKSLVAESEIYIKRHSNDGISLYGSVT
jgi:hypothetical protein